MKTELAGLKTKVDDINVEKPKNVPADLTKLSNLVDNGLVKNTVYDKLLTKVNTIDTRIPRTSVSVTKIQFDSYKLDLEKKTEDFNKKIPSTSGLVNKRIITQKF